MWHYRRVLNTILNTTSILCKITTQARQGRTGEGVATAHEGYGRLPARSSRSQRTVIEIEPPDVSPAEAAVTWRWATPADMPALRVCHFRAEVEAWPGAVSPRSTIRPKGHRCRGKGWPDQIGRRNERDHRWHVLLGRSGSLRKQKRGKNQSQQCNAHCFPHDNRSLLGQLIVEHPKQSWQPFNPSFSATC